MPLFRYEYGAPGFTGATVEKGEIETFHLRDVLKDLAARGVPNNAGDLVVMQLPADARPQLPPAADQARARAEAEAEALPAPEEG